MHLRLMLLLMLGFIVCLNGCDDSKPSNELPQAIAKPSNETPEGLAKAVFESVKANDFESFRHFCLTWEDMVALYESLPPDVAASQKEMANEKKQYGPKREARLRLVFDTAVSATDWKDVQIKDIKLGDIKKKPGGDIISRITLTLNNNWKIQIEGVGSLERGWIIGALGRSVRAVASRPGYP